MGNNKSKPTGTIHVRTTPEPFKAVASVANMADSTMLVLETGRTAPEQDTMAVAADATAIATDGMTGTLDAENVTSTSLDTEPASSLVETVPCTSAANTAQAPSTMVTEPVAAVADTRTKMEIATEIFRRLKKVKGITRKEIIDQFVTEAKLSKAGASTYYQLIKAKVEEK